MLRRTFPVALPGKRYMARAMEFCVTLHPLQVFTRLCRQMLRVSHTRDTRSITISKSGQDSALYHVLGTGTLIAANKRQNKQDNPAKGDPEKRGAGGLTPKARVRRMGILRLQQI